MSLRQLHCGDLSVRSASLAYSMGIKPCSLYAVFNDVGTWPVERTHLLSARSKRNGSYVGAVRKQASKHVVPSVFRFKDLRVVAVIDELTTPLLLSSTRCSHARTEGSRLQRHRADVKSTSSGTPSSSSPMSYADLLQHGCKLLAEQGMKQLQVRNLASALRGWVTIHGFVPERVVGEDFTTDFDRLFARYCHAISGRQAVRTQRDRRSKCSAGNTLPDSCGSGIRYLRRSPEHSPARFVPLLCRARR